MGASALSERSAARAGGCRFIDNAFLRENGRLMAANRRFAKLEPVLSAYIAQFGKRDLGFSRNLRMQQACRPSCLSQNDGSPPFRMAFR